MLIAESGLVPRCLRILLEPAEEVAAEARTTAEGIVCTLGEPRISDIPRLLHGNGAAAWPMVQMALAWGCDTRIGLEDTLVLPDGTPAPDNAALVAQAIASAHGAGQL